VRYVQQEDPMGCMIAAAAMVLDVTYQQVSEVIPLQKFDGDAVNRTGLYALDQIERLARNQGWSFTYPEPPFSCREGSRYIGVTLALSRQPQLGRPMPPALALATGFDLRVRQLHLTPEVYIASRELHAWCERNRNRVYIPEWLLGSGASTSTQPAVAPRDPRRPNFIAFHQGKETLPCSARKPW